jgi:hypothetical protein
MYKENAFKGQKILVCAFWSKCIADSLERDWVDPKYLFQRY